MACSPRLRVCRKTDNIPIQSNLSFEEARPSVRPQSGLMRWVTSGRPQSRRRRPGAGTGGVSLFALHSPNSPEPVVWLRPARGPTWKQAKKIGADVGYNSKNDPEWARPARKLLGVRESDQRRGVWGAAPCTIPAGVLAGGLRSLSRAGWRRGQLSLRRSLWRNLGQSGNLRRRRSHVEATAIDDCAPSHSSLDRSYLRVR